MSSHQPSFTKRLLFGLLRKTSQQFRARTDLFDNGYEPKADWRSGLGNGGHLLYSLTRCLYPEVVVEIGSARGKSTCCLAQACKDNQKGKVYAIDPHIKNPWSDYDTSGANEPFLRARLSDYGLNSFCEIIRETSVNAAKTWNRPIDLIFIDGDHTYEGVKADFEMFQPYFTETTLAIFHDTSWNKPHWDEHKRVQNMTQELGVPTYLDELQKAGYPSITFPANPGITVLDPHIGGFNFVEGKGWPVMQART